MTAGSGADGIFSGVLSILNLLHISRTMLINEVKARSDAFASSDVPKVWNFTAQSIRIR
ncbi:hypothetical protein BDV36DRAFT_250042 [Aspergillus pseudocaelatus]|uniref:Uncharacterized protein n=1 Tax=Aspergillus pseudocaelatus TaxID=1825620 RepID=A0ABQ6WVP2_9EURO|nr:hypothetical protein BDV36DRAFT_250042 [Aspergillus pseudocaelatus]